jgi:hypothetical protein
MPISEKIDCQRCNHPFTDHAANGACPDYAGYYRGNIPPFSRSGAAVLCGAFAIIGLIIFAATAHDATSCNSLGAFAPQECSTYQAWHDLGIGAFIIGLIAAVIFAVVAIAESQKQ